jgi:dTDP-4-amino-4,6-dideoxygalactose transaminase
MLVGATPVFADVEPDSGNISARTIEPVLTERTKAIIPVHLSGWPADMPSIMALAQARGIKVIEDCAQSQGAAIDGRSLGSFGDAAAFSFCQDKIISTSGEGGFLSIRDEAAWEWAWSFKDHGKSRAKLFAPAVNTGMFRWLHDSPGTNWRLSGPQAAIGLVQLGKLDAWTQARTRNAAIWSQALADVPGIRLPQPRGGYKHAYYKHYFYLDAPEAEASRLRSDILQQALAAGLRLFSGSCSEMYQEQAFAGRPVPKCPVARAMSGNALMVEVHPTLDPDRLSRRAERLAAIARGVLG